MSSVELEKYTVDGLDVIQKGKLRANAFKEDWRDAHPLVLLKSLQADIAYKVNTYKW